MKHTVRYFSSLALILALFALTTVSAFAVSGDNPVLQDGNTLAEVLHADSVNAIPNQYIVVFHNNATEAAVNSAIANVEADGGAILHTYGSSLNGFAAEMSARTLDDIRRDPGVAYVEVNQTVSINVTWGLDRTDQRDLPLDNSYDAGNAGTGVHAYIIDTGIRMTHNEFDQLGNGYDFVDNDSDYSDCDGHGTHVAGTVGGTTYGIAPNVTLHGIRVLDCQGSGSYADVIAGIDWVTANHTSPAVANMSLGGGASTSVDNAVNNSVAAGVSYAVAAGNENANACNSSPARAADAITVAASDDSDTRASFSNYGSCVDIFAPGVAITSASNNGDNATETWNGTSMATPHVAGAIARYLSDNPGASTSQVTNAILGNASSDRITDAAGSPNKLLYVGTEGDNPPPPPPPASCDGQLLTGSLSGTGDSAYYYLDAFRGTQTGELSGPDNADFDLYLYKWHKRNGWQQVASSTSGDSEEIITYSNNKRSDYRWEVSSYSGSGDYEFCFTTQ